MFFQAIRDSHILVTQNIEAGFPADPMGNKRLQQTGIHAFLAVSKNAMVPLSSSTSGHGLWEIIRENKHRLKGLGGRCPIAVSSEALEYIPVLWR